MKYKAVVSFKDTDGHIKEESVSLTAQSKRDAEFQCHVVRENAERQHGKANVIGVRLASE